ncbi:hypothetical protein Tco_0181084, partial [Tanacetum coccineum]
MASMNTRLNIEKLRKKHGGAQGDREAEVFQVSNDDPAELQGAQGGRKAEIFQVSNDDTAVAQRRLEDKQPEEKINTDCLVKEKEKEYQPGWKIKTGNVLDF